VPSHPWHVSLGTDQRVLNLIFPLLKYNVEVHYVDPFGNVPLTNSEKLFIHNIKEKTFLSSRFNQTIYRFTRRLLNSPFWSRMIFRWSYFLEQTTTLYAKRIFNLLKQTNPDVLFAQHDIAAMACLKLREQLGVPVIVDLPGVWSEEMISSGIIARDSRQAENLIEFDGSIARNADILAVVSNEMKDFLIDRYSLSPNNVIVLLPSSIPRVDRAKRIKNPSKIVFSGMATYRERLDLLIKAMPVINSEYPSARLYLTNKGDILNKIRKLANAFNIYPEYFYFPSPKKFYNFLSKCHIGVVTSSSDLTRLMSYPAKLYDYFSVGLPIVANDIGGWTEIIREKGVGILTDSSSGGIAKGILELLRNPDMIYEMGQKGLDLLRKELNPDRPAKVLYDTCMEVVK